MALAQPAAAVTFPTPTTIYVGSGVRDDGGSANVGIATVFLCSNVSGATANLRFLVLSSSGTLVDEETISVGHGGSVLASTHSTVTFIEVIPFATGIVTHGVVNIESTQSGVFCTAVILNAASNAEGVPLHLVRVNAHPGTVE